MDLPGDLYDQEYDQFHHHNYFVFNNSAQYIGTNSSNLPPSSTQPQHGLPPHHQHHHHPQQQQTSSSQSPSTQILFQQQPSKQHHHGLEAYAKNDPSGCASGIIPGITKSESTHSRKRISAQQTAILEDGYQRCAKPDKEYREELAERTGLPARTIQIWFQNRRAKAKSQQKNNEANRIAGYQHQYTLNPPPPPHQTHRRFSQSQQGNFLQFQSHQLPPGQITSQIVQIPPQQQQPPSFQPQQITPDSYVTQTHQFTLPLSNNNAPHATPTTTLQPPPPPLASSQHHHHHHMSLPQPPPIAGFGSNYLQSSPTLTSDNEVEDGPLLTPLSSLQSPSTSPYVGTVREKRTPTMDSVPESVSSFNTTGDSLTKRRKSGHNLVLVGPGGAPQIRRSSTTDNVPFSATEPSFPSSSPCSSPQQASHHNYYDNTPPLPPQAPSSAKAAAAAAAAASSLRRSVSASGSLYNSRRYGPHRMVRHNSSSNSSTNQYPTTPVVYEEERHQQDDLAPSSKDDGVVDANAFFSIDQSQFFIDSLAEPDSSKTFEQMMLMPQNEEM